MEQQGSNACVPATAMELMAGLVGPASPQQQLASTHVHKRPDGTNDDCRVAGDLPRMGVA